MTCIENLVKQTACSSLGLLNYVEEVNLVSQVESRYMLNAWLKDGDEQKGTEKKERNATPGTDHTYCMCNRQPSD